MGVFIALPIVLAGQFEGADRKMRGLVSRGIENQHALAALALQPTLDAPGKLPSGLSARLAELARDNNALKLMLRPASGPGAGAFYFVAAAPAIGQAQIDTELDRLGREGVLDELLPTCTWKTPAQVRHPQPGGGHDLLTSIIPIDSRWGCWVLVSSHSTAEFLDTSIGGPYWNEPHIRLAVAVYIAMALLGSLSAWSVWRGLRRFRRVAGTLRRGRDRSQSFSAQNDIPELASVAADFDQLVADLHGIARNIRRTAEDNAHALKSPVAAIQACLEPLRRSIAPADERANRSLMLIGSSVRRLNTLIAAAQRLDYLSADLIDGARETINLSQVVSNALLRYREIASARGIRHTIELDADAHILGNPDAATVVVDNILDNAISFSPRGGTIAVMVARKSHVVELRIMDEGPGIAADKIHDIFERYVSLRPRRSMEGQDQETECSHAGLGLWIVRRHVKALGGAVEAFNRGGGGTSIVITFPAHDSGPHRLETSAKRTR